MTRSTFHPLKFGQYIIQPYQRQADGGVKAGPLVVPRDAPVEMAGHGVWSTPNDHAKLLSALLRGGAPILSTKSVDEIFTPQLPDPKHLEAELHGFLERVLAPTIPRGQPVNHGLGGVVNLKDFPARRSAGTLQWVGAANQFWVRTELRHCKQILPRLTDMTIVDRPHQGSCCFHLLPTHSGRRCQGQCFQQ